MRLQDRIAIVVGAGQSPGEGIGNGRATALTFAREGAKVLCVDHHLDSAQETVDMIGAKGGTAVAFRADVTREAELKAMVADAHGRWGRIDILHNNVGVSIAGGDAELSDITEEALDRCVTINLKSCIFAAKHVIPIMRAQRSGAIINISSMAVITTYPYVAYKATKAAMVSFTEQLAYQNAQYGIRANVILPGLMNTPMAVDTRAREFKKSRAEVEAARDAQVPLRNKMGTGWDVGGDRAAEPADHALSGPTRTSCLPKLAPFRSPMNASGALSRPSVMHSRCLSLPSRTHCDMSRRKSAWRAAKSLTMKPRMVRRFVSTARIIEEAHIGALASVSL
jgi:NAD(P)-dependent dehydrogenase (short-subunit alcohol dehydrogenase family)